VAVLSTVMQSLITPSGLILSVSMQNVVAPLQRELGRTESSWQDATQTNSPLPFRLVAGDSLRAQCYKQITVVIYDWSSHGQVIERCPYKPGQVFLLLTIENKARFYVSYIMYFPVLGSKPRTFYIFTYFLSLCWDSLRAQCYKQITVVI
jgi:hypothetical protein